MSLKITKSSEPIKVDRLNVCIYAQPGIGKTSLAFTAERPLLLDFDRGSHRAANRKDVVQVATWPDVTDVSEKDLADYATVIVDTAGRALDVLSQDIIRRKPKEGRGGALSLQGYGSLKTEFTAWLKMLNGFGKDVILIAHMDEKVNGDEIIERLDVQGGSKNEIYKAADAMGRIQMRDGKRMLVFSPTDAAFGKNPGQLEPLPIPDVRAPEFEGFLAGVVGSIKDRLNALTEEQQAAQQLLASWRTRVADLAAACDFNQVLPAVRDQPKAIKALFNAAAEAHGLHFDQKAGEFVERAKAA